MVKVTIPSDVALESTPSRGLDQLGEGVGPRAEEDEMSASQVYRLKLGGGYDLRAGSAILTARAA